MSQLSILADYTQDPQPLSDAKARLEAAVKSFEDNYSAFVGSKTKLSQVPNVTLQQIASSYGLVATNSDAFRQGQKFSTAVEQLLLLSVGEELEPTTKLGKKAKATKESVRKWAKKAGEFTGKLLPLAITACRFTAVAGDASVIAFPLKAAANGVALVLQLAQKENQRGEELFEELDRISYQSRRAVEIQKLPRESLNSILLEKSLTLMAEVINFLTSALKYLSNSYLTKVTKTLLFGPEIWQTAIKSLHLAYEEYDQALLLQIASTLISQSAQNQVATLEVKDDAFRKWLAPSTWEVEAQLQANLSQRASGTLHWILELEKFKTWRVGELDSASLTAAQTLWITGLPGTGKSTASAYLYNLLVRQYPDAIILHFFCKSGTPGLTTAHDLVRTICHQLTEKDAFYRRYLQGMPNLPTASGCESLTLLFKTLIKEPLLKGPQESEIFIFLDGLDELDDTSRRDNQPSYTNKSEIEVLLEQVVSLPRAKILVTSRSSPELKGILSQTGVTHVITRGDNSEDITRYVNSRIEKSPKLADGFREIEKDPVEFFKAKSNGIFLWAALVLDMLERSISLKRFSSTLEKVPPTMNNVYDQILTRARQSGNYDWVKEILGWTLIVPSPFTMQQMETAVELSKNDNIFGIEDFLRSECGSLLDLVPVLGTAAGKSFEIHIGHETFQSYLTDPANPEDRLFSPTIAHGKAALACLRYLVSEKPVVNQGFGLHAVTRWRWHLRLSIGLREREFAEPLTALDGGSPLPMELANLIFGLLHQFLTTNIVDPWLEYYFLEGGFRKLMFSEVYHTCVEVAAWCETNQLSLGDPTVLEAPGTDARRLSAWREGVSGLQCIVDPIWPRACHVWLWNTWTDWWAVLYGYESLVQLNIFTNHPDIRRESHKANQLLEEQEQVLKENESRSWKTSGKLNGNLSIRYANYHLILQEEDGRRDHFDAIAAAGENDEMSGICQGNLSIACYSLGVRNRSIKDQFFEEGIIGVREALDEEPTGNARYYEHLGRLYSALGKKGLALDEWRNGIDIDHDHLTNCREEYYQLRVYMLTDKDYGCVTPDYDAAITILEVAIRDDPANANSRWFHQMADMYKKKGDLEGARRTYRANMEFDPSWNSQWEDLARTFIDEKLYEEKRQFDWRGYCEALADATIADPSRASNHWGTLLDMAMRLKDYQHFGIAVEMLTYGVERTSQMKTKSAIEARPNFELKLGETFCSMAKWESAIPLLEDSLKHKKEKPKSDLFELLGHAYKFSGRYEEALAAFHKIIENDAEYAKSYAELGEVHLISGNPSKAIKEYKAAIRLQEKWAAVRVERYDEFKNKYDQYVGEFYMDLGTVYERLSRPEQARNCFQKALPHVKHQAEHEFTARTQGGFGTFLHRSEGRALINLAWLYERLDPKDKMAEETYEKAVGVFKTSIWEEDDFLEEAEYVEAEAALERVRRGEPWVFPGEEVDRELRKRAKARTYRSNWGVNLDKGEGRSMMRGH